MRLFVLPFPILKKFLLTKALTPSSTDPVLLFW